MIRFLRRLFTLDQPSPIGVVDPSTIKYNRATETLTLKVKSPVWITDVADTNSMDGLFDKGDRVVVTASFDKEKLTVGDVIIFQPDGYGGTIIHRIVKIGRDRNGKWYKTKGDNCIMGDPYKLRSKHIKYLLAVVIYTKKEG